MIFELGRYMIMFDFKEIDRYGLDVDFIEIEVNDKKLNREIFECVVYCIFEIKYDNGFIWDDMLFVIVEWIVVFVNCFIDDNFFIFVYYEDIKYFLIIVILLKYCFFENYYIGKEFFCSDDNSGIFWSFLNLKIFWDK